MKLSLVGFVAVESYVPGQPDRFIAIGYSALARILVVVHPEMGDTIRIISARKASRHERQVYAKERS
jgi:uncharacterized DUF497 family protein